MEIELKLELAAEDAARIAAAPALADATEAGERHLVSTYFDTAAGALRRAGLSLRVRHDGDRRIQTVKAEGVAAGLFVRPEWEREIEGDVPIIDEQAGPIAALIAGDALAPRFVTDVHRAVRVVAHGGARIEVALDTGEVRAGDDAVAIAELELELRDGPVAALFSLARSLDAAAPLRLGAQSKAERGHALAEGAAPSSKAEPVLLDADGDAAQAFAAVAQACLRHFRLNETRLLGEDVRPAPLHQARVGLRRLRSAFSLFRPILKHDPQSVYFARHLKALAAVLGDVRDLDVLIAQHSGDVRGRIAAARAEAFATARTALASPETRRLLLDLAEWLADGAWRTAPAKPDLVHAEIKPFAADLLAKRRRRLKLRGKHLARLDVHDRHQVRIEAKKLRYAAEFFGGLWSGRKARHRRAAFADAMEALQDELGHLNDAAHGPDVLAKLGLEAPASLTPEAEAAALARAAEAYAELIAVKRFWR